MPRRARHLKIPTHRDRGGFFLYLRVVRNHSLRYALELARALDNSNRKTKCARRFYETYRRGHWEFSEESDGFNLWQEVSA